jgi:hypothetical protein
MAGQPDTTRAKLLALLRTLMSQRWDRNAEQGSHLDDLFYVFFRAAPEMDTSIEMQEYNRVVGKGWNFAELRSCVNQGAFDEDVDAFFLALEGVSASAEAWVEHKHGPLADVNMTVRKNLLTPARALRALAGCLRKRHFAVASQGGGGGGGAVYAASRGDV